MAVTSGKQELLKWFLDFVNLDIEQLGHGDRLKWITEALYIIEFGVPTQKLRTLVRFDKTASHKKISEWDTGTKLEECHGFLKAAINSVMEKMQQAIDSGKGSAPKRKRDQKPIFATLKTATTVRVQTTRLVSIPIHNKRVLHTIIDAETDNESLLIAFYRALEGVQIGSLHSCPECGNYFLHTTKMKKKFCTNKCAARKASRDRRKRIRQDPKKHAEELRKAASRARKSYEKNVKRGTPKRRPYKHKDLKE